MYPLCRHLKTQITENKVSFSCHSSVLMTTTTLKGHLYQVLIFFLWFLFGEYRTHVVKYPSACPLLLSFMLRSLSADIIWGSSNFAIWSNSGGAVQQRLCTTPVVWATTWQHLNYKTVPDDLIWRWDRYNFHMISSKLNNCIIIISE